jgi:hypothetical protein
VSQLTLAGRGCRPAARGGGTAVTPLPVPPVPPPPLSWANEVGQLCLAAVPPVHSPAGSTGDASMRVANVPSALRCDRPCGSVPNTPPSTSLGRTDANECPAQSATGVRRCPALRSRCAGSNPAPPPNLGTNAARSLSDALRSERSEDQPSGDVPLGDGPRSTLRPRKSKSARRDRRFPNRRPESRPLATSAPF